MRIVFISKEILEEECGWMPKDGAVLKNETMFKEVLQVNTDTLEVERAKGYDSLVSKWLKEGKVIITD